MKIGVLSIQGLPARYGAFEQTIDQIVRYASKARPHFHFYVGCTLEAENEAYCQTNVTRLFFQRKKGLGVLVYGLHAFFLMYRNGVRKFLVMGYGLAPFFWLFQLLGCQLICNVDGFEWRRAKWGALAKAYFKLCEYFSVHSKSKLIYDSIGVERYYLINHRRKGHVLFYGTEQSVDDKKENLQSTLTEQGYDVVVMRMEPENHILEIVSAYLSSTSSRKLVLIGPSTEFFEHHVLPRVNDHAVENRVTWLGPIYDREKLRTIRSQAFAYIHGHSVGGTNPTLVEACHLGRPIIAFGSIFNREVLGACGTYFHDQEGLRNILNESETSLPLPPHLDHRYTWDHVCEGYLRLID